MRAHKLRRAQHWRSLQPQHGLPVNLLRVNAVLIPLFLCPPARTPADTLRFPAQAISMRRAPAGAERRALAQPADAMGPSAAPRERDAPPSPPLTSSTVMFAHAMRCGGTPQAAGAMTALSSSLSSWNTPPGAACAAPFYWHSFPTFQVFFTISYLSAAEQNAAGRRRLRSMVPCFPSCSSVPVTLPARAVGRAPRPRASHNARQRRARRGPLHRSDGCAGAARPLQPAAGGARHNGESVPSWPTG